jgi:cell wall assembly regulator SMI1
MQTILTTLILAAVALVAIRHLVRTFFYPSPTAFPKVVADDIDTALARFEQALHRHAPDTLAALQPGLSDAQIDAIEREHHLRLTDDLRALYRWRNGSPPDARIDLIPGHRFVPLNEAAAFPSLMRQQLAGIAAVQWLAHAIFAGHRTGWLPILDDGAGDGYFYDPARRRRRAGGGFFYHFAQDRHYRFFPALANFLVGAAECYETGIYRAGRRGRSGEDFERSFALWSQYATSPGV